MKAAILTTSLIFIFSIQLYSQAGWTVQDDLPVASRLGSVYFPNSEIGLAWGYDGVVMKTTNGGQAWNVLDSLPGCYISQTMFWKSADTGWSACNSGELSKTIDGGKTWKTISAIYDPRNSIISSIFFVNDAIGWITGYDDDLRKGFIFKTTNGGINWASQNFPSGHSAFNTFFINESLGYAWGGNGSNLGSILFTNDGGEIWSVLYATSSTIRAVKVMDQQNIWAVTVAGSIINTKNGGLTWEKYDAHPGRHLRDIDFGDEKTGIVVGDSILLRTVDGGSSWIREQYGGFEPISVDMISPKEAWTINWGTINSGTIVSHTYDSGKTWEIQPLNERSYRMDVHFTNKNNGWSVGYRGRILHTTNAGNNWSVQNSHVPFILNSVCFVNDSTGWIAGERGTMHQTSDRGINWNAQSSNTDVNLNSIHFVNSSLGWYCGDKGILKVTIDGGTTWSNQTSGTTNNLNSIYFIDPLNGWVAGDGKVILQTKDGGKTWDKQTNGLKPTADEFNDVYFVDNKNGWLVGNGRIGTAPRDFTGGVIYSTTDGGATWTEKIDVPLRIPSLNAVFFVSDKVGTAVGESYFSGSSYYGMILHTDKGGESWEWQKDSAPFGYLESVFFIDSIGWAAGGLTIKTNNYGGLGVPLTNYPNAPSNLTFTTESGSSVILQWKDNSTDEIKFEIERTTNNDRFFVLIGVIEANQVTFRDEGLDLDARYQYRVRAINNRGASSEAYSDVYMITGISETASSQQVIYPNPTEGILKIKLKDPCCDQAPGVIVNLMGSVVKTFVLSIQNGEGSLDLTDLDAGLYILQIKAETNELRKIFIKD